MSTDRIEKQIDLNAPPDRVWRAISDHREFGAWFGVDLATPFVPGQVTRGRITEPPGYEHLTADFHVEAIGPGTQLVLGWHPYAIDPAVDYTAEPRTTVTITVAAHGAGTRVTIVEAGFDAIPEHRRAEAFRMNAGGWEAQLLNIKAHVGG